MLITVLYWEMEALVMDIASALTGLHPFSMLITCKVISLSKVVLIHPHEGSHSKNELNVSNKYTSKLDKK